MRVIVVLDFPNITDLNSADANLAIESVDRDTSRIAEDNGAACCWIDDAILTKEPSPCSQTPTGSQG